MAGSEHSAFRKGIVGKAIPFLLLGIGGVLLGSCSEEQTEIEAYRADAIGYFETHRDSFVRLAQLIDQTDGVISVMDCEADDPFCTIPGSAVPPLDEETREQFIKILRELDLGGDRNATALHQNQVNGDVTLSPSGITVWLNEWILGRKVDTFIAATFMYSTEDIFTDTNCVGQLSGDKPPASCFERLADGWGLKWSYQRSDSGYIATGRGLPR